MLTSVLLPAAPLCSQPGALHCSNTLPVCRQTHNSLTAPAQVLQTLPDDGSLDRFRSEYEKLFKAVRGAHGAQPLCYRASRALVTYIRVASCW